MWKSLSMFVSTFKHKLSPVLTNPSRSIFAFFRIPFNAVDKERLKVVGADRLCAEWILKNGGIIRFRDQRWTTDYNALPGENQRFNIAEVDATKSTIMAIGFDHFRNCPEIEKMTLKSCKYMENEAIDKLGHLKSSLQELEINSCYNVVDEGLRTLKQLENLKKLTISNLPYVKDMKAIESELRAALKSCTIDVK